MVQQRAKVIAWSLFLGDLVVLTIAFFLAYILRDRGFAGIHAGHQPLNSYLWLLLVILPLWAFTLAYLQMYKSYRTSSLWAEPRKFLMATILTTTLLGTFIYAFKLYYISRLFIGIFAFLAFFLLSAQRIVIRSFAKYLRIRGMNSRNVLIVGSGKRARELAKVVEDHKEWGLKLLGIVAEPCNGKAPKVGCYPVLGSTDKMADILHAHVVDEVLFAVSRKKLEEFEDIFLMCEELGIRARVAINFFPHMIAKVCLDEIDGIPLLTFSTTPQNEFVLVLKRAFDILVSSIALILFFPFFLPIALAIKLDSPGPIFFKQARVSLNGRQFTLYKFRSMVVDAEEKKKELLHLNQMNGPIFKLDNDPRITKVGRFLRKSSLDEVPQFFNVLKGDMSIIGPRPHPIEEVKHYQPWQRRRLSMRPGLTCLWQINGRSSIRDFEKTISLDLEYIDSWSFGLDLKIFFKTIPAILLTRGAK